MILKDFPPEDFVFRRGQNSKAQNCKILHFVIFYRKSIETLDNVIFAIFANLNSVHNLNSDFCEFCYFNHNLVRFGRSELKQN